MSFLELRGVEKTYPDGTAAVRGVELAAERGEFVVLLGPSGCGKTTTLRMVAGLESPSAGAIVLDGVDVTNQEPSRRDVGFVFQFYALYPHLSVRENVAFPLRCAKRPKREVDAAVDEVARRLGLVELLARRPRELSGGDQQRVALARAMVRRPALFLMDEPLGTLDADRRMEMAEFLRARQLELGVTTLYVTHDQAEAMSLADRIVVMEGGLVRQVGAPAEVYDEPATRFVASFVGSPGMNFVEGAVEREHGSCVFRPKADAPAIPLRGEHAAREALLGLRPEALRVHEGGAQRARLVVEEYLGAHANLHLDTAFGRLVARAEALHGLRPGEELRFDVDPERARLFDATGGGRL